MRLISNIYSFQLIAVAFIIEDVVLVVRDGCVGLQEIKKQYPEFGDVKLEAVPVGVGDVLDQGNKTRIANNLHINFDQKTESERSYSP